MSRSSDGTTPLMGKLHPSIRVCSTGSNPFTVQRAVITKISVLFEQYGRGAKAAVGARSIARVYGRRTHYAVSHGGRALAAPVPMKFRQTCCDGNGGGKALRNEQRP
jgi:hypothetical protein